MHDLICRKSSGFSRGASMYRGVTRHHQHGRWQARIGRVSGNKDLYLGTFGESLSACLKIYLNLRRHSRRALSRREGASSAGRSCLNRHHMCPSLQANDALPLSAKVRGNVLLL
jgi:hypothetical protein